LSDYNRSISALPEEPYRMKPLMQPPTSLRLPNYNNLGSPPASNGVASTTNGELDNLCQLEESDDDCETPTVEVKTGASSNPNLPRVTQV